MGFFRSNLVKVARRTLALGGIAVTRPKRKFGIEPFTDVKRLASHWNRPMKIVFDVGANDGDTALALLYEMPEARVFSFEPHPLTFAKLVARIGKQSRFQGVNIALSSQAGSAEMIEYEGASKVNSLTPDAQFAKRYGFKGQSISVRTTTVDEFCVENSIERIDLLKIDTEGFDLVVLEGCHSMLSRRAIEFIYLEYNELQPKEGAFGGALVPIDTFLRPYGYRFMTSYNDSIMTEGEVFSVSNALFARLPY